MPYQPTADITLTAKNIGPLRSLSGSWQRGLRAVLFAPNGSGKTFISRMFQLQQDPTATENLLTQGAAEGSFSFLVNEQGRPSRADYTVALRQGSAPEVTSDNSYLFRVFNTEYTRRNLAAAHYAPTGDIEGYIVGGENIDLAAERAQLSRIVGEGSALKAQLDEALDAMRDQLKGMGVRSNMREFKELTPEGLTRCELPESHAFDLAVAQLSDLSAVDPDAYHPRPLPYEPNTSFLDDAMSFLSEPLTRSGLEEAFVQHIAAHQDFIATGVRMVEEGDGTCPFCGTPLDASAAALIHRYTSYLNDAEAQAKDRALALAAACDAFLGDYRAWETLALRCVFELTEVCGLVPSLAASEVPDPPASARLEAALSQVKELLTQKAADVSQAIDARDAVSGVRSFCLEAAQVSEWLVRLGAQVMHTLSKMSDELRDARKALCVEALYKLRIELNDVIVARAAKQQEYAALRAELRAKESVSRVEKRALVAEQMAALIARFFGDKYVFDPQTFTLRLGGGALPAPADQVLSEGERQIVAFCHYLASLPVVLSHAEDWDNLYLVIDDPVSGLDSRYVDLTAFVIGLLGNQLAELSGQRPTVRVLVLTHNGEFINRLKYHDPQIRVLTLNGSKIHQS